MPFSTVALFFLCRFLCRVWPQETYLTSFYSAMAFNFKLASNIFSLTSFCTEKSVSL
jgi:hypothetical protein